MEEEVGAVGDGGGGSVEWGVSVSPNLASLTCSRQLVLGCASPCCMIHGAEWSIETFGQMT